MRDSRRREGILNVNDTPNYNPRLDTERDSS